MNDILENLIDGNYWIAYVIAFGSTLSPFLAKGYKENPRLKWIPLWGMGLQFFPLLLNMLGLISNYESLIIVVLVFLFTSYIYLINYSIAFSHEKLVLKYLAWRLRNRDDENNSSFYARNKRFFITHTGRYHFGLLCMDYWRQIGALTDCFVIVDDIQSLKLTKEEKRIFVLKQLNLYRESQAVRLMENTYESTKYLLNSDDQLYIESLLAYHKLELVKAEKLFQKLLANTSNDIYRQIAINNIGVIAECNQEKIEWSDYIYKSFTVSQKVQANIEDATLNLIDSHICQNKLDKAEELFQNYIKGLPVKTLDQRIGLVNIKLHYYRQTSNQAKIADVIGDLFKDYQTAGKSRRYPILVSLIRISYNHNEFFEQVLVEVDDQIDQILIGDFALVRWITLEILAIPVIPGDSDYNQRVDNLALKCIERVNAFDIDHEISKLRIEDVVTKRAYFKFKSKATMFSVDLSDFNQYKESLFEKFKILDELIKFDEKQGIALNLLDSLIIKLDELTCSLDEIANRYRIPNNSEIYEQLLVEGNRLISKILPIIDVAEHAPMLAHYHLQLAHYYCCLKNKEEGYKHFMKFKESNVNLLHYASFLRDWYSRLDNYFRLKNL